MKMMVGMIYMGLQEIHILPFGVAMKNVLLILPVDVSQPLVDSGHGPFGTVSR